MNISRLPRVAILASCLTFGGTATATAALEPVPWHTGPYANCLNLQGRNYLTLYGPQVHESVRAERGTVVENRPDAFASLSGTNNSVRTPQTGIQRLGWLPMIASWDGANWRTYVGQWFGADTQAIDAGSWGYWTNPPAPLIPWAYNLPAGLIGTAMMGGSGLSGWYASASWIVQPGTYWIGQKLYWSGFSGASSSDFANRSVQEWTQQVTCS